MFGVKIILTIVGLCLGLVKSEQSPNTCTNLQSCLTEVNECKKVGEVKMEKNLNDPKFISKMKTKQHLTACDDTAVKDFLQMQHERQQKESQRQSLVSRCISGDATAFPGCLAFPLPAPDTLARKCKDNFQISNETDVSSSNNNLDRPGKRNKGGKGCQPNKCKKTVCGCPESRLCHECYEVSTLHDEIHTLNLKLQLARAKCSGGVAVQKSPQRDSPLPDEDEKMLYAWTN